MALAAVLNQGETYWFGFIPLGEIVKVYVGIKNDVPNVRVEKFKVYVLRKNDRPFIRTKFNTFK